MSKYINTRISDELYGQVQSHLELQSLTMADFMRQAVELALSPPTTSQPHNDHSTLSETITALSKELESKNGQLDIKDEQISELHRLLAMTQANMKETTGQLDRAHLQLEDLRSKQNRSWWQKLFATNSR